MNVQRLEHEGEECGVYIDLADHLKGRDGTTWDIYQSGSWYMVHRHLDGKALVEVDSIEHAQEWIDLETRIKPKYIILDRGEGPHEDCKAFLISHQNGHDADLWTQAQLRLIRMGTTAPEQGNGYDKVDFTVVFQDGESYSGRFDLQRGGQESDGCTLRGHIFQELQFACGNYRPLWMSDEDWNQIRAEHVAEGDDEQARAYLAKYYI